VRLQLGGSLERSQSYHANGASARVSDQITSAGDALDYRNFFRLEAEAAASLDHPCIVPIYEVGEREGSCYFSMKFVEGGQLDDLMNHGPISIRGAVELIAKLARTVQYAHEHGVLHRPAA
jgi:serine/threonine protein kinase